ncbi:MAG: hypothetical protein AAB381_01985 [Patescibacteria group bacterium]
MNKEQLIEKNKQLVEVLEGRDALRHDPLFCQDMVSKLTDMIAEMKRLDNEELSAFISGPYFILIRTFGSVELKGVKDSCQSLSQVNEALDNVLRVVCDVPATFGLISKICEVLSEKEALLRRYLSRDL